MNRTVRASLEGLLAEDGQALLETALALPVLLLILFGIIEFGIAIARYQVVTNASREGARAASLFRLDCNDGSAQADAQEAVQRFADRLGIGRLDFTLSGDGAGLCASRTVRVTVTFEHRFPIVSGFARRVGFPQSIVLRHTTTSFNENLIRSNG
jgi:Flp pilus assembly protein TadG